MLLQCASLAGVALAGCQSRPASQASVPQEKSLDGSWSLEFRVDSVRSEAGNGWQTGSGKTASGTLRFTDTDSTNQGPVRNVSYDILFAAALGRPMSCYTPGDKRLSATFHQDSLRIWFTPGSYDCGFSGDGKFFGDSLIGEWSETSFRGPVSTGRFRMVRLPNGG